MTAIIGLRFRVGARTLFTVRRRLVHRALTLEEALCGSLPSLPALREGAHGYYVRSVPVERMAALEAAHPGLRPFVPQRYARSYAALDRGFDAWLAGLSGKSRSTLKRKARKLAERSGGALDLRCYRTPDEMAEFHRLGRLLSARTYQERLLRAGLPDGERALSRMRALAKRDAIRGWILFLDGRPIAYLHAPARGDTLTYAHLGYDPAFADLSPGTVLQFEAMRQLFAEGRFRRFDFGEGEGRHKRQFETGAVQCADVLLVRPTLSNLLTGHGLEWFDAAADLAKRISGASLPRRLQR